MLKTKARKIINKYIEGLTDMQMDCIAEQLTNDEASSDDDLYNYFMIDCGYTKEVAQTIVSLRDQFLGQKI